MKIHIKLSSISIFFIIIIISFFVFSCIFPHTVQAQEDYTFDLSEIEKKPYQISGSLELRPVVYWLNRDASLYKLKFYNRNKGKRLEEYNLKFQLEGSYEWKRVGAYLKTNTDLDKSYLGSSEETKICKGYMSIKPSPAFSIDIGKIPLKWGKGYAWNPVGFVDRPKNPDNPDDTCPEGYIVAKADYIKSFSGRLKSLSVMPVLIPVYEHINEDYGKVDHLNFAMKTYFLFYDTDIDLIFLSGGSKSKRYGLDFSRNIRSNFEIHGEFAFIKDSNLSFIDCNDRVSQRISDAKSYLLGIRYLTESDTTYICEYYHNGTGFYEKEMRDYFTFIDKGYDTYLLSGNDSLLNKASNLTEKNYGRITPMRDYLYLRISQKEPFNILYFTPAVSMIYNLSDDSFSLSPELLYNIITNLELRLKVSLITGDSYSEYGEKQNEYKAEFRGRYYF